MNRWSDSISIVAWRGVALVTLIAFVTGSIGLAVVPRPGHAIESSPIASTPKPNLSIEPARCCCGRNSKSCSCGCRHVAAEVDRRTSGGCCKEPSSPSKRTARLPVMSCPCSGSPQAELLVSAQPKLGTTVVRLGACVHVSACVCVDGLRPTNPVLPPDTPPPRPSAG